MAKVPNYLFAEAHRGFLSEPIHMEDEVKDQEDEVEDGRDCEEGKVESRREVRHTRTWNMDGMTRTDTLSQCHVRHRYESVQTRENVTCEGVLFTVPPSVAGDRRQLYKILLQHIKQLNYELNQFSLHCHYEVLEEEDECHLWY